MTNPPQPNLDWLDEILTGYAQDYAWSKRTKINKPSDFTRQAKAAIATKLQQVELEAFKKGQRVGQYQAADRLYGHITIMWLFKEDKTPKLEMPERANDLLKDCEKYLNHNVKVYKEYVAHLKARLTQKGDSDESKN